MHGTIQVSTALLLPHLLFGLVTLALLFLVPGHLLVARRLPAGTPAIERWVLQATFGFWSVAFTTQLLLALPIRWLGLDGTGLVPYLVAAAAAIVCAGAWVADRRRPVARVQAASPGERLALGVAAAVAAVFFVGIDGQAHTPWCLYEPLDQLMQGPADEAASPLFDLGTYERLGNVAANLLPFSLYEMAGVRVASGLFAGLLFLSTAALARRITGRTWAGIAAGGTLMVTGDVLGSQVVNVNMIAAWLAAVFLLLLQPGHRTLAVERTFVAAALFSSRYVALLSMGALAVALWRDRDPGESRSALWRRLAGHAGLFVLFSLPVHLFHIVLLGTPLAYRALEEYSAHPHVFAGIPFTLHAMLNVPFYAELVRTPFNPFPMWLGWPIHAFRQWGALGVVLLILGGAASIRAARRDRTLLVWLLFAAPTALFLLVQENWIQPEKLTIGLLLAPVATTALAAALVWLARPPRGRRLAIAAGTAAAVLVCAAGVGKLLSGFSVPQDPRFRVEYPSLREETPAFSAFLRESWLSPKWTPLAAHPGVLSAPGRKVSATLAVLGEPGFRQRRISPWHWLLGSVDPTLVAEPHPLDETIREELHEGASLPFPPAVEVRHLALDLSESPTVGQAPLGPRGDGGDGAHTLDLTDGRRCTATPEAGLRVSFMDTPGRVIACRASEERVYLAVTPPPPMPRDEDILECRAEGRDEDVSFCDAIVEARDRATFDRETWPEQPAVSSVGLVLPQVVREVVLVEIVHLVPMRIYVRDVAVASDTPVHSRPRPWRHN